MFELKKLLDKLYLNLCCSVGIKTPRTVDPHDTKKSASLRESCFVRVAAAVILGVVGWIRAADERRFCHRAPRDALLRICLQDNTEGTRLSEKTEEGKNCSSRVKRWKSSFKIKANLNSK